MTWAEDLSGTAPSADDIVSDGNDVRPDPEQRARELAKLKRLEYEQVREKEAQQLGIRLSALDDAVKRLRGDHDKDQAAEPFEAIEPWPQSVDGGALLDRLCTTLDRFVRFVSAEARDAVALWVVLAHAHDAAVISPLLAIESPEKRSGKTTLLSAVSLLVPRAMPAVNCSPSVLFRAIERYQPTILIDEGDTFLRESDDLRGILNGGHNRLTAYVLRNAEVNGDYEPRRFNVWGPKVVSLIGDLPDTLQDRAIVIPMRRKLPNETVERFRADRVEWADELKRKAARWAADNRIALSAADPDLPGKLHDRAADNWRTMMAIADRCGWSERARRAALVLSGAGEDDDDTPAIMLLADCRDVFDGWYSSTISPSDLAAQLVGMEGRPWSDWRMGKPISERSVGRLLAPFGIKSHRTHKSRLFHKGDFEDVWKRYVRPRWNESNDANDTALETKGKPETQTTREVFERVVCDGEKSNKINGASFASSLPPDWADFR